MDRTHLASHLAFVQVALNYELDRLGRLHQLTEALLKTEAESEDKRLAPIIDKMSGEDKEGYSRMASAKIRELSAILPQYSRRANFLMAYGSFERYLNEICDFASGCGCDLELKDIAHSGVKRASIFLNKVLGTELPAFFEPNREAYLFREVRNVIAHRGGRIKKCQGISLLRINDSLPDRYEFMVSERTGAVDLGGSFVDQVLNAERNALNDIILQVSTET